MNSFEQDAFDVNSFEQDVYEAYEAYEAHEVCIKYNIFYLVLDVDMVYYCL